jgi:hypothetical protein
MNVCCFLFSANRFFFSSPVYSGFIVSNIMRFHVLFLNSRKAGTIDGMIQKIVRNSACFAVLLNYSKTY